MTERERVIRKTLADPQGAFEALALRETALHGRILAWASQDANLAYLESCERAAVLILEC